MMELYKQEKINPLSGCLPIVVQIPVFFALYTGAVRHDRDASRAFLRLDQGPFSPDPTTIFNLFGLIPWIPRSCPCSGSSCLVWR